MKQKYYKENRSNVYENMKNAALVVFFSGGEIRKSGDECYDYFGNRNFLYLTGIQEKNLILLAGREADGTVWEKLYLQIPNLLEERWSGKRIRDKEAAERSGITIFGYRNEFRHEFHRLAISGKYQFIYTDGCKYSEKDGNTSVHYFLKDIGESYPYLKNENAGLILRKLRMIKQDSEVEAIRKAEKITDAGIRAMMKSSHPGMYEYQYKAEFDYVLGQYGTEGSGFPPIISAGKNNFCIHYYDYKSQAMDGDMILNDVGARWDGLVNDVSRTWPCNGIFTEKQKLLYKCALATSDHMFCVLKPGIRMAEVDPMIRKYNFERMKDVGICKDWKEIGRYMWHGGAHHIGYDCHDEIQTPEFLLPGMVFCVDVGIYHEEWGIGFRLEDNCLITEEGCENLSSKIPRTISEIEFFMKKSNL